MNHRPARIVAWSIAIAVLLGAPAARAQTGGPSSDDLAKLKAAFVLNLARYAEWPASSFSSRSSSIVIGVVGDDRVAAHLEELVEDETVDGRGIEVSRIDPSSLTGDGGAADARPGPDLSLRRSHLVFIGQSAENRVRWLLDRLAGQDVLTVSDLDGFAEHGGMIGLVLRNRRLAFDANVQQIEGTRVSISSQVLRLARIVASHTS